MPDRRRDGFRIRSTARLGPWTRKWLSGDLSRAQAGVHARTHGPTYRKFRRRCALDVPALNQSAWRTRSPGRLSASRSSRAGKDPPCAPDVADAFALAICIGSSHRGGGERRDAPTHFRRLFWLRCGGWVTRGPSLRRRSRNADHPGGMSMRASSHALKSSAVAAIPG
jgi:hypothetical protein